MNEEYKKGELLREGKTKRIWEVIGDPSLVIIEAKIDITAFDDKKYTKQFASKAACATATTCRVFEMLNQLGIKTAYVCQLSETEFVAKKSSMIALEVIARRYAYGSFLKRVGEEEQNPPRRFDELLIEFFLKTTGGNVMVNGVEIPLGIDVEDPLIKNPFDQKWDLLHPKKPSSDPKHDLGVSIAACKVIPFADISRIPEVMRDIEFATRKIFQAIEDAFERVGIRPIDFKIEFGYNPETGEVFLSDVIDNDSWRIRDEEWQELSKERFRQGEDLEVVAQLYQLVAQIVSSPKFLGKVA